MCTSTPGYVSQGAMTMTTTQAGTSAPKSSGLDGVTVADTVLSGVDGERGQLVLRGYDIESIAGRHSFEEVLAMLWDGALPDANGRDRIRRALGAARAHAFT